MEKLREQYEKEVIPALMKKFNYKSVMQVPKLDKIVINIGLGETKDNPKALDNAMNDLSIITDFEFDGINDENWAKLKSGIVINSFEEVLKKNFSGNNPNGINDLITKPSLTKSIKKIENGEVVVITPNGLKYHVNGTLKQ